MRATTSSRLVKVCTLAAFFCLTLLASQSSALLRKGQLGTTASIVSGFPSGNFSDLTNTGLGVGIELEYYISQSVAVGFLFNYLPFQGPDIIDTLTLSEEWTVTSYGVFGKIQASPEKEVVPYVKVGGLVSFYEVDITRQRSPTIDTSFSEQAKLTAMGGVGMRWDIEHWVGVSGELLFTKIFDVIQDLQNYGGRRFKVDAQYVSFNLNATIFFGGAKK